MIGIQISLNGKLLYTVGVGEFGSLVAGVDWTRNATPEGSIVETLWVGAKGYQDLPLKDSYGLKHSYWQNHAIKVGDEISMRIVETDSPDQPLPGHPDFPFSVSN